MTEYAPGIALFMEEWAKKLGVQNHPLVVAAEIITPTYENYPTAAAMISGKDWVNDAEFLTEMVPHVRELYNLVKDTTRHGEDGSDLWANYIDDVWLPWYKANVRNF